MKKTFFLFLLSIIATWSMSPSTLGAEATDIAFSVDCTEENMSECNLLTGNETRVELPMPLSQGDRFTLQLFVLNPEQKDIVTVRSWISYDSALIKAIELSDTGSDFPLAAPDGNEIDEEFGQVKIGRGVAGGGVNQEKLFIAHVTFEIASAQARDAKISFVNFQKEELGETGVFILDKATFQPENILIEEPRYVRLILNGGVQKPTNTPKPPQENNVSEQKPQDQESNILLPKLDRPENLRVQAKSGSTHLIWQLSSDPNTKGYYVYYSENSGFYIRRSDVGFTNHKEFTDLNRNRTYYFAVTAYDSNGQESDYSDEVSAIHGVPGSESHPFTLQGGEVNHVLTDTSQALDESGPAEAMQIAFGVLGISVLFGMFLRRKLFFPFS